MEKTVINPSAAFTSVPFGFSQAIKVTNPGSLLFVAGQGAFDEKFNLVGAGDIEAQTRASFAAIARNLAAAGASFKDVVRLVVYCSDIEAQRSAIRKVRAEFVDAERPPASTMIEVSKFAETGMLIEIEATAVVP